MSEFSDYLDLPIRPRRNRRTPALRGLVRETRLAASQWLLPLFCTEWARSEAIASMPGCKRWSVEGLVEGASRARDAGVRAVVLFPRIAENLNTPGAEEAWNPDGLVPRAIRALK